MRKLFLLLVLNLLFLSASFVQQKPITIAIDYRISELDTISINYPDAAADRIRTLIFNSLVKKNEKFEYVGELAKDIKIGADNTTVTFTLADNVKFHNGKVFTSADAKYTLDALFAAGGYKGAAFFDLVGGQKEAHITSMETPDAKTLIIKVRRPALVNQLLSNLVAIPIIPENSVEQQKTAPIGTGAFKFASFDAANSVVALEANADYWEGAPKIQKLNVKTVADAEKLESEILNGSVNIAINPTNFSPQKIVILSQSSNLQVVQGSGANIRYIGFNLEAKTVKNLKFRQAIGFAIDREKIIKEFLYGQAKVAHSILPFESWAYSAKIKYDYNPSKAKELLKQSGYKGQEIVLKIATGNETISQYAQIIQNYLKEVGINSRIEPLELNTLFVQLKLGDYQMTTSQWIVGNQDPVFLQDLFQSQEFPDKKNGERNRSRYSNRKFDEAIETASNTIEKEKAKQFYEIAQDLVANDLPMFPLWYSNNIIIANKKISNIKIETGGDWNFIKNLSVE
jgi:peptide/nickel transport system substrate-binding protein